MWALYNSYHYSHLDRCNKDNINNIRKKSLNKDEFFNNDLICQGNSLKINKINEDIDNEFDSGHEIKKLKNIRPLYSDLWEKSVYEANQRKKHGCNIGEIYNESYDMSFREFPDEYIPKNNPNRPKLYEELNSNDLSWMTSIPLTDIHSNLTLEQQYYHLKDMEKYYLINLWKTKWDEIRPERDYWYELRDNTFWMEAQKNRFSVIDPEKRLYFLNILKDFCKSQQLHYNKYKDKDSNISDLKRNENEFLKENFLNENLKESYNEHVFEKLS
ncbi:hypothetical protein BCR32DRAFT_293494 [Anaeromyces robustus]|uniref:Uncharacterized protein n=1 Tax=Anaeromyces robustus TaxID=1754192 RepID=A0A1Y1X5W4_9FUNG|nr:hypothetical protein BCR32DRAFT_293494 [Anaeromyces robustus]|eukprot:ORX81048.1 hypothetical protein BCR32DRAFT_293494 [Anaeromyces robustus]